MGDAALTAGADARRSSPAVQRNRDALLAALHPVLPDAGTVLEVASGSGEHAAWFARHRPRLTWQPSDPSPEARASAAAWAAAERLPNLLPPLDLDAAAEAWPSLRADAVLCVNMVHISPWAATEGLVRHAARLLPPGGPLILYGPFTRIGTPTAPSNLAFDADLRRRDPRWGVRSLEAVAEAASRRGLRLETVIGMPANNLTLVIRRDR